MADGLLTVLERIGTVAQEIREREERLVEDVRRAADLGDVLSRASEARVGS